jgi:hypothetical protein
MQQFIKILLIIFVISLLFWFINSDFMGNNAAIDSLIEEQDRVSTPEQSSETDNKLEQSPGSSTPTVAEQSSQMITTEPVVDDAGLDHTLPDSDTSDQQFGDIGHILTPEEREAMMQFAPEAGDNGLIGEAPEAGDSGIYSDGPGSSDTIMGESGMSGMSLEDSFDSGLQGESTEGTFGIPPEDSQPDNAK